MKTNLGKYVEKHRIKALTSQKSCQMCRNRLKAGKCQSQEQSWRSCRSLEQRRPLEATSHMWCSTTQPRRGLASFYPTKHHKIVTKNFQEVQYLIHQKTLTGLQYLS